MENEIPDGVYSMSRSEYLGGIALPAIVGVPLISIGISGFIPDKYDVTMPLFGTFMILFGVFSAGFLQGLLIRKVNKSNGILRTQNPFFLFNQCFDIQKIEEYRYRGSVRSRGYMLEILYKGKWKLVMGNMAFLKQLPPNRHLSQKT